MRLPMFAIIFLCATPALAQTTPYYPTQTTNGNTVTTTATPLASNPSIIAPAPASAPAPVAAPMAASVPTPVTTPTAPPPLIQNLWRGDAGVDAAADLMNQKRYSDALTLLDLAIQRNMRNADAHVFSAICWANLGNMDKAKNALGNAFAIDKGHMGAYLVGGVIALQQGDKTQANYYLNAIRTVCQADTCPEYQTLRKAINEAK